VCLPVTIGVSLFYMVFPAQVMIWSLLGLFLQTYEKVATAFKSEEDVVVANVDADKHKDLAEK